MKTANLDGMRMDIFREIIKLDENKLREIYNYIISRSAGSCVEEKEVLKKFLFSSVREGLEAQKEGKLCSTEIAMAKLDEEMQWK